MFHRVDFLDLPFLALPQIPHREKAIGQKQEHRLKVQFVEFSIICSQRS
jgi:hypothetical protein